MTDFAHFLCDLIQRKAIPGLSIAALRQGELDQLQSLGVRGAHDASPVDAMTVFEAASLTKPIVALVALQLVDEGLLDLDRPLIDVAGEYVPNDERARRVTARHVLTHTSGFPNLITEQTPLKTYFEPGERFSYGSSAFAWLQRAIEHAGGHTLERLTQTRVLQPLGMAHSSLEWQDRFEANHAQGHDWDGQPVPKRRVQKAQASWSLLTCAGDYARFVRAVLQGKGLRPGTQAQWFHPAVHPRQGGNAEDLPGEHPIDPQVAWGLGWGLEPAQQCFFHWGHSPGFRAFVIGQRGTGDAMIWFANAASGLRLAWELFARYMPGPRPSIEWMHVGK